MRLLNEMQKMKPVLCISFTNESGLECYVVIDSLVNDTSCGGVRIVPDLDIAEVCKLATEMTLKYAFCGLSRGGAKCGIRMPSSLSKEQRIAALEDAGRRLRAIIKKGIYYPGMDMNCGSEELGAIYRGAGFTLGKLTDTSFFTAVFAAEAVRAFADMLFKERKGPLTLAVEGFGKVASHLSGMLEPERFRIVALSTMHGSVYRPHGFSPEELSECRSVHGDALVEHLPGNRLESREDVLFLPVDILLPAARVGSVHKGNMGRVTARCVVSVANAPCTAEALEDLHRRRIPVLPGFVGNAGGVLGSSLFDRGVPRPDVQKLAAGPYRQTVSALIQRSMEIGEHPTALATRIALNVISARGEGTVSLYARLLSTLSRRCSLVRRYVNRNAAHDCAMHFAHVAESVSRLSAGNTLKGS